MAMQVESLEVLEKAEIVPTQARAIVRAIEIELAGAMNTFAKKSDIAELGAALRAEMGAMRGELKAEVHASASAVVRQMYMAVLGQMAVLLGFAYFFATHVR